MAKSDSKTVYALTNIRPSNCPEDQPDGFPRGAAVTCATAAEAEFFVSTGAAQREPVEEPKPQPIPGEAPVVINPDPSMLPDAVVLSPNSEVQTARVAAAAARQSEKTVAAAEAAGLTTDQSPPA